MSHILKTALCFVILSVSTSWMPGTAKQTNAALGAELTINVVDSGTVSVSWDAMSGATSYRVTARDKSNNQMVADFNTSSTSTNVDGLSVGHNYTICVKHGSTDFIICDDTQM